MIDMTLNDDDDDEHDDDDDIFPRMSQSKGSSPYSATTRSTPRALHNAKIPRESRACINYFHPNYNNANYSNACLSIAPNQVSRM